MSQQVLIASLVALMAVAAPSNADEVEQFARVIIVTGEGETTAPPDMATIRTGVVTQAATAKEALKQNNVAMENIFAAIEQQGIAKKDVQTSNFSVSPVYKSADDGKTEPEVVAHRVQNVIRVRVRNLASLGSVLDALVQAGSNEVSGISFGIDDPSGILNEARSQAIRDAKTRADVYAQAAGVAVGPVRQISEQTVNPPRPMYLGARMQMAASSVPIATGEQVYRVTVNVVYELEPSKK